MGVAEVQAICPAHARSEPVRRVRRRRASVIPARVGTLQLGLEGLNNAANVHIQIDRMAILAGIVFRHTPDRDFVRRLAEPDR